MRPIRMSVACLLAATLVGCTATGRARGVADGGTDGETSDGGDDPAEPNGLGEVPDGDEDEPPCPDGTRWRDDECQPGQGEEGEGEEGEPPCPDGTSRVEGECLPNQGEEGEGEARPSLDGDEECLPTQEPGPPGLPHRCLDLDGDGYGDGPDCLGTDCDDTEWRVNPGSVELCGDNLDNDCDRSVDGDCDRSCDACGDCDVADPGKPLGAACGPSAACDPSSLEAEDYYACLDSLCASGLCIFGFCAERCRSDGDCDGAVAGPYGSDYRCFNTVCMPGGQAPCDGDSDCVGGERCNLGLTEDLQGFQPRCGPSRRCGPGPGELCNDLPSAGPLEHCVSGWGCNGRCLSFCGDDQDCAFDPTLTCVSGLTIDAGGNTAGLCLAKTCNVDADCGGGVCDFGIGDDERTIVGRCYHPQPAGRAFGRACDDDRPCRTGLCVLGECVRRCLPGAADCGLNSFCDQMELCIEIDRETGACQRTATADICRFFPGSAGDCQVDDECPRGERCVPIVGADGDRATLERRCRAAEEGGAQLGEACDPEGGRPCAGLLCTGPDPESGDDGYCSATCTCNQQCGEGYACRGASYGAIEDGLGQGYCFEAGGSMTSCRESMDACPAGERCLVSWMPATDGLAYRCVEAPGDLADGLPCDDGDDCRGGVCWRDEPVDPERQGYCTRHCHDEDDCGPGDTCEAWAPNAPDARRDIRVCRN